MQSYDTLVEFRKATKALSEIMGRLQFYDDRGFLVIDSDCWDERGEVIQFPWAPHPTDRYCTQR